jgi:hypothetical protein
MLVCLIGGDETEFGSLDELRFDWSQVVAEIWDDEGCS